MKKNLLLTAILLLTLTSNSFSQEYHPMLNNTSWIIADMVSCCRPSVSKIIEQGTDTIIGSYTYKKFKDPFPQSEYYDGNNHPQLKVCLREDVAAKKVYKFVNGADRLLYDFNLETGDVISQYDNTFTATVDYIVANDGSSRKRITLTSAEEYCSQNVTMVWIEGIGSTKHPFYPQHNMYNVCSAGGGLMIYTKCCFQNGEHIAGGDNCTDLMQTFLAVDDTQNISSQISCSPNPFSTAITIQSAIALKAATIRVYNTMGLLVRESNNESGTELKINTSGLQSGLYLLQVLEKGKVIKTAKIMAE